MRNRWNNFVPHKQTKITKEGKDDENAFLIVKVKVIFAYSIVTRGKMNNLLSFFLQFLFIPTLITFVLKIFQSKFFFFLIFTNWYYLHTLESTSYVKLLTMMAINSQKKILMEGQLLKSWKNWYSTSKHCFKSSNSTKNIAALCK